MTPPFISRLKRIGALAIGAACAVMAPQASAATPLPDIVGPIPATATSYPFGAADHTLVPQTLARVGYVEEEYFASGKANVYTWPAPGPAVVRTAGAPYTTRVLIRRPADPGKFSGNVVVEMLNPSNLFDMNIGWGLSGGQFSRDGDVWVGITVKPVSMVSLKNFDPVRYAPLALDNPLPRTSAANCHILPTDTSRETENGLVWDIYSQVGAWLRSQATSNPLREVAGFRVRQLYGFGYSQTGGYFYNYINGIHPLVVQSDGAPIYDAYLVAAAGGAFGGAVPMNQCEAAPPLSDPRRQFDKVGVPVIHLMSQSDYLIGIGARRPDSDAFDDRYRHYEMAGSGHATPDELYSAAAPADILKAGRVVPAMSCQQGPRSRFPSRIHVNAALRNLDQWVRSGLPPPHAAPIEVVLLLPVHDRFGNVEGGLRSPYVDVPTSTWAGNSTGALVCLIAGHEHPFDAALLRQLYRDDVDYQQRVRANVDRLHRERFLTAEDAAFLIEEAMKFEIPDR